MALRFGPRVSVGKHKDNNDRDFSCVSILFRTKNVRTGEVKYRWSHGRDVTPEERKQIEEEWREKHKDELNEKEEKQ